MAKTNNVVAMSLRFNLNDDGQRRLWEAISSFDTDIYKSKNNYVLSALEAYIRKESEVERQKNVAEKQETFLQTVKEEMRTTFQSMLEKSTRDIIASMSFVQGQMAGMSSMQLKAKCESTDVERTYHEDIGVNNPEIMGMIDQWND